MPFEVIKFHYLNTKAKIFFTDLDLGKVFIFELTLSRR
jgi:hypothetical protein